MQSAQRTFRLHEKLATMGLLVVVCLVTMAGEFRCNKSLNTPVNNTVNVADLVFSGGPYTADFRQAITVTVTAVDAEGRPVRDSQGGIDVEYCSECVDIEILDIADADNAMIQVRIFVPPSSRDMTSSSLDASFINADGTTADSRITVGFTAPVAGLSRNPQGPLTLQLAQVVATDVFATDGQGTIVARADQFMVDIETGSVTTMDVANSAFGNGILERNVVARTTGPGQVITCFVTVTAAQNCPGPNAALNTTLDVNVVKLDVANLITDPASPITLRPGERVTVHVTARSAGGTTVLAADGGAILDPPTQVAIATFPQQISAVSITPSVVEVVETQNPVPVDGRIAFVLEARGGGDGTVVLRHPDMANSVDIAVHVAAPPPGHVIASRSTDEIHVGLSEDEIALTVDAQGFPIAGDEFVTAVSSNPSVAAVEAKIDTEPNDGLVAFRIRGVSVGTATITFHYPGGPGGADTTDTTVMTVNP